MNVGIGLYEDWMRSQVATLFSRQYGVDANGFSTLVQNFYEHPYQLDHCIRIVATDGKKVVGFQSFFLWPYFFNGKKCRSFQSGNSLVDPDYRGKSIFQKMLTYLDEQNKKLGIDFLVGFPINVSRNSLLRNGWKNILDLDWYISSSSPLRSLAGNEINKLSRTFNRITDASIREHIVPGFRLSAEEDFREWRSSYSTGQSYFYHVYREKEMAVEFILKPSRRKKIIRELVIGNIRTSSADEDFLLRAFMDLRKAARRSGAATFLSLASNMHSDYISANILSRAMFRKIEKKIFFAVKSFSPEFPVEDASKWILFRSDIDTW